MTETGITVNFSDTQLLGAYDHIYSDNCFAADGTNTHYVVLAYKLDVFDKFEARPDHQHIAIKWWPKIKLLISPEAHQNTKNYFIDT